MKFVQGRRICAFIAAIAAVACASAARNERSRDRTDDRDVLATARGEATYYADFFEGRRTASGIVFRNSEMFAAHRHYPFGTMLRVTVVETGRSVVVRVVDRLPPAATERARRTIVDLSHRAAETLGFIRAGRVQVRLDVLEWGRIPEAPDPAGLVEP
ncbi:MAG: septal ring lytic transglycosylase RlpA family protein [Longimicrobiales bacterium]